MVESHTGSRVQTAIRGLSLFADRVKRGPIIQGRRRIGTVPGVEIAKQDFRMGSGKNEHGFSFIELVVVIVIMSVLISVGSPYLSNFYKGIKIESSARQLRIFLSHAGEIALSEKKICRIKIASDWKKLTLYAQKDPEDKPDEYVRVEGRLSSYDMIEDISIDEIKKDSETVSRGSETDIDVYPLFSKQEITFLLKDSADNKTKVKIEAGSGRVTIE